MNNFNYLLNDIAHIPNTSIRYYSFLMGCSILLVLAASFIKMKRRNIPTTNLEWKAIWIIIAGVIGGRIWFVINNISSYNSLTAIFALWDGGMGIQGAVIFGCITGFFIFRVEAKTYHISMWVYLDCFLPNVLIGQALGRWGNFFNQEILGPVHKTKFSWLPDFINNYLHYPNEASSIYRHPLFLYESFLTIISWGILTFIVPKIGLWISKKPWNIEPQKYQIPIVSWKNAENNLWKLLKLAKKRCKAKKIAWKQAYYEYEPVNFNLSTPKKHYKFLKISPNLKKMTKIKRRLFNFYFQLISPYYYNAKPLNDIFNPHHYKITAAGVSGSLYFVFYGIIRILLEPLRFKKDLMQINGIATSITLSILWITIGFILVIFAQYIAKNKFRKKGWFYERQY